MMWFFAILVVLALGAVAVVASGRGTPMARVYDDRPDLAVPATGPLSADDLRRVRFPLAFRGYRMDEVDALLDRLAREKEADAHDLDEGEDLVEDDVPETGPAAPTDRSDERPTGAGD